MITSPNYPQHYPLNMDCVWQITVDHRRQVVLTFADFFLEYSDDCGYDHLAVSTACTVNSSVVISTLVAVIVMVVVAW